MAFNMEEFIKTNLIQGYLSKDFSEVQINIFMINYLSKGMISQGTFDEIVKFMEDNQPSRSDEGTIEEIPVDDTDESASEEIPVDDTDEDNKE